MSALYPWHGNAWQQWQQLRARLPHAVLFYGTQGTGKTHFAEACAAALLCETPDATGHACGSCIACGWFAQYSHPDFRRVRPEALEDDGAEGDEESDTKKAKSTKAPSKDIKIDQVRALGDFMNVSTHRSGMRVVLLHPVEALNTAAANSLLKMLEEPPPHTIFLMVSNGLDRLLPTILSRCRKFALPMPDQAQALQWLREQDVKDADGWLAEQGGAPLAAMDASLGEGREAMDILLRQLAQPSVEGALKTADALQKIPVPDLVAWQQRWLYDVLSSKLAGTIRYYPRFGKELMRLAQGVDTAALLQAIKAIGERRAIADHPLAPKLFIEDMLLEYTAAFS
ncbi:DNA polymerase III subunit delta' [Oxalicibacterium faecigallinarum]|uniref:DNA polymerase III subunit delta n=1 Tax=Oxalicibacterium faecigallinarum TaxID=573741 RepID=A0A8J3ALC3_9BURK|nr:DNA polymerase III subunit delta' [Oxalicibacterium faecigallinarum]GGI16737.1 DNA polymerase III subunit delta' [Oxalicibacterium faecigallinarum]